MKKYILGTILSLAVIISPAFVQAQQSADLTTTQISAIIQLLQSFGASSATIANVSSALGVSSTTQPTQAWCHTFSTNLMIGDSGSEVRALGTALTREGFGNTRYAEGMIDPVSDTGDYIEPTAAAVSGFQEKYASEILAPSGLKHGTGYVGPATRAKLNSLYGCSNPPVSKSTLSASPAYGSAPLTVSFSYNLGGSAVTESNYSVTFGDGATGAVAIDCGNVVGGSNACPRALSASHTYTAAGTYKAKLMYQPPFVCNAPSGAECAQVMPAQQIIGTATVTVSVRNAQAPVISGVSGPTSLQVGQQGTWTVKASDPNNGTLNYSVVWGDEPSTTQTSGSTAASAVAVSQQATFTHAYSQSGNYLPKFTVTNSYNQFAWSSISVTVGSNTSQPLTVLSPNGGETWTKGTMQKIAWQEPPLTFPTCPPGMNCVLGVQALSYDIQLAPYYAPCTSTICPKYPYRSPYTVASGLSGSSFSWSVGNVSGDYYGNATDPISDGQYTIQVCQTGTSTCDSSDNYFKIVSATTQTPVISSLSPSSGPVGTIVTIGGSGFTDTNSIYFDGILVETQSNSAGSIPGWIKFAIPSYLSPTCSAGLACAQYLRLINPGIYNLQISNANGKSSLVPFTVTAPPCASGLCY